MIPKDRWEGVVRPYAWADVRRLQGHTRIEYTLAEVGARRLWTLMTRGPYVKALGASTGNMAVQQVRAGMEAIYCSGWQVAADANTAGQTYPDQSLYPVDSVPTLVRRINNALLRAEQIDALDDVLYPAANATHDSDLVRQIKSYKHWMAPIVADAEAGFGGSLNVYELVHALIEAGAAGVHLEDQLASEKKCGHLGGKVLVPTSQFIRSLIAARLAADVMQVPTVIIARTDALGAKLITSDVDVNDDLLYVNHDKSRTPEGFYYLKGDPMQRAIDRSLDYAPYADMLWFETSEPNMEQARRFADGIHARFPRKLLAYNCSPSFNWKKKLSDEEIAKFQDELGKMGYAFQFVTLAGFHALSHGMFELASGYRDRGMTAYAELQAREFNSEVAGYTATKHQHEVGTGYFDAVAQVISGGMSSTLAMGGSTESEQFSRHEVRSSHVQEEGARPPAIEHPDGDVPAAAHSGGTGSSEGPVQHPAATGGQANGEPRPRTG